MSMQNFGLILKNKMAAIAYFFENHKDALNLEILQLASSNLHKIYMARKVSLIVIWASFENKRAPYHMFYVKWDYPIKKALYLPYRCY